MKQQPQGSAAHQSSPQTKPEAAKKQPATTQKKKPSVEDAEEDLDSADEGDEEAAE